MELRTDRLVLRPLSPDAAARLPEDRDAAAAVVGAALDADWPLVDLLDVLPMQATADPDAAHFGVWAIIERDSNIVVGDVGFMGPPDADGVVEIGYSVVPGRRGRGYATEAAHALVDWATSQDGIMTVVAGCSPDNAASIRILERLGFERTSTADTELRWRRSARMTSR
jgi:ribosomal-protein-alanine N-acetyltransferase